MEIVVCCSMIILVRIIGQIVNNGKKKFDHDRRNMKLAERQISPFERVYGYWKSILIFVYTMRLHGL